jgi:hypothetical protein
MTAEYSFCVEKLPEGSRIEQLSIELEKSVTHDTKNFHTFLFDVFHQCCRFVFKNTKCVFSPKIELNLIYQTEQYRKIEKEKTKKTKKGDKWKSTAFHIGNNFKGQIFVNVEERFALFEYGFPTFILNFVMTYFHEILHCCFLNLRTEKEIFTIEYSLIEKFLEIQLPQEWKTLQSKTRAQG